MFCIIHLTSNKSFYSIVLRGIDAWIDITTSLFNYWIVKKNYKNPADLQSVNGNKSLTKKGWDDFYF